MADEVDEVPAGHYRDAVTGEIKPKMAYERPVVEDLGDLADTTLGEGGVASGDPGGSI